MNIADEYFWKAQLALQTNRLFDSCTFIYQAIEQINENTLTLEQIDLIWSVIPKIIRNYRDSIERLVSYHQSMPIETDESFDRLTQSYVEQLEQTLGEICLKFIDYLERYLIQDHHDIDHIHLKRLQADLYLQLSYVSRPYQHQFYYSQHRKILLDNEHIITMYKNSF